MYTGKVNYSYVTGYAASIVVGNSPEWQTTW